MRHIKPCRISLHSRTSFPRRRPARAITKRELGKLALSGRKAIEHLMLCILMRPRATTDADIAELDALGALLKQYNEALTPYLDQSGNNTAINGTNKPAKQPGQSLNAIHGVSNAQ